MTRPSVTAAAPLSPRVSTEDQQVLDLLRQAVTDELERKRRLGQYAVFWRDGGPVEVAADSHDFSCNIQRDSVFQCAQH
jgi:hypothetical protein